MRLSQTNHHEIMKTRLLSTARLSFPLATALAALLGVPSADAASNTWGVDAAGNWATAGSWTGGVDIPGSTTTDNSDVATFSITLTAARIVTVDADRFIGGISFGNTFTQGFTLNGGLLRLNSGGVIQTLTTNGNHSDTINSAIVISGPGPGATAAFTAGATSATSLLKIAGGITGSATAGDTTTLTLNGTNAAGAGGNASSGIIGDGAGGGMLAITKSDASNWNLTGMNTYTGATTINAGTLTINAFTNGGLAGSLGMSSNASSNLVMNGGTLAYTGGSATTDRGLTLNGNSIITVSSPNHLNIAGVIAGGSIDFTKGGTGTLTLSGLNTYTGRTFVSGGTVAVNTIKDAGVACSLGMASTPTLALISIGTGTVTTTLSYIGTGDTSDRVINLPGTTGGAILDQSGSGPLKFTSALTATGSGAKTLTLQGSTAGTGELGGAIVDSSGGATSLTKSGTGTWTVSGANTFTGATVLNAGTLKLNYDPGAGGTDSSKLSDTTALTLNGGTLELSGGSHPEVVLSTALTTGGSFIKGTSSTATLQMGEITFSSGALDFSAGSIATTTTANLPSGTLGDFIGENRLTVAGTDFAKNDGSGNVVAFVPANYTTFTGTMVANANYSLAGGLTISGPIGGDTTDSLKITTTGAGESLALGSNPLTVGTILFAGANDYAITTGVGGAVAPTLLHNYGTSGATLTLGALGGGLVQFGTGKTILSAPSTFDGGMTVNGGTVQFSDNLQIGTNDSGKAITLNNGRLLADTTNGDIALDNAGASPRTFVVTVGGGTIDVLGSNTLTVSGAISGSGPLTLGRVGSNIALTGAYTFTGTTTISGMVTFGSASAQTVSGTISGTGSLTKSGAGVLTLSGTNTYTGATHVNQGILALGNTAALTNTSAIHLGTATGGTLRFNLVGPTTITAPITVADTGVTSTLSANFAGGTVVANHHLNGAIGGDGNVAFVTGSNLNNTFSTFTLNAASTYAGTTTVNAAGGTGSNVFLALGIENALPSTTVLTFGNTAGAGTGRQHSVDLNGFNQTLGGVTSTAGNLRIQRINNTSANVATLTVNDNNNRTFTGLLGSTAVGASISLSTGNNFGVVKNGTGTWTLAAQATAAATNNLPAPNSYTGGTILNQGGITLTTGTLGAATGTLQVNNTNSTADGTDVLLTLPSAANLTTGSLSGTIATPTSGTNTATIATQSGRTFTVNQTSAGTYAGVIAGAGNFTIGSLSTHILSLSGANTYTGHTTVAAGTLVLADNAQLKFVLGSTSGTNNTLTGAGTAILDGDFVIDTSAADGLVSGTWTLEDVTSLTSAYGASFSVVDFVDAGGDKWTKTVGSKKYTFDETTGILTLVSAGYASWIDGFFPGETNPVIIGASADPDNDGIANGVEMVIGGNPATGMDTALLPTIELVTDPVSTPAIPAGNYLLFTYRRSDLSVAGGVTSDCETDTDLVAPWTAATGAPGVVIQVDDNFTFTPPAAANTDRVRVYVPRGANTVLFGRLNVKVP